MRTHMEVVGIAVNTWLICTGTGGCCLDEEGARTPPDLAVAMCLMGSQAIRDVHGLEGVMGVSCLSWTEGFQRSLCLSFFHRSNCFDQCLAFGSFRKFSPKSVLGGRWICRVWGPGCLLWSAFHGNREGIVYSLRVTKEASLVSFFGGTSFSQ